MVTGDLTMKDKTKKSISIPFKRFGPMTLTVGDKSTRVGIVAEPITLRRSDFRSSLQNARWYSWCQRRLDRSDFL